MRVISLRLLAVVIPPVLGSSDTSYSAFALDRHTRRETLSLLLPFELPVDEGNSPKSFNHRSQRSRTFQLYCPDLINRFNIFKYITTDLLVFFTLNSNRCFWYFLLKPFRNSCQPINLYSKLHF